MKILVSGSSGLIGGEAVEYFDQQGHVTVGVDNNQRREFFGKAGDTSWNMHRIFHKCRNFTHEGIDIRDYESLKMHVFDKYGPFDAVVHCAAQPSHDKAREIPLVDFGVNALGTLNMLELTRQTSPAAAFVFMSTNKVYGDAPNRVPLKETDYRYDYEDRDGIDETMQIDQSTHSVFGASKVAADIMVQEYGHSYGMNTCVLRGGCLTGPAHSSVELHGFLSFLVKQAVARKTYQVFGYAGKQVRDNIHSYDVVRAIEAVIKDPRPAAVYNIGGGRENSTSILEAIGKVSVLLERPMKWQYVQQNRLGDHICYITDLTKFRRDYPDWQITKSLDRIFTELIGATSRKHVTERYTPGDGEDEYFESYTKVLLPLCTGRVLDIGCGHGYLTSRIADLKAVTHVTGTDKQIFREEQRDKIFYWKITTEDLVNTDNMGQFDTIISTEHIEHVGWRVQDKLLDWIRSVLAPGGKFIGSMPGPDDAANPNPYHLKTFTLEEWRDRLLQHFSDVTVWMTSERGYCWRAATPL